jgi:hypothetical protein
VPSCSFLLHCLTSFSICWIYMELFHFVHSSLRYKAASFNVMYITNLVRSNFTVVSLCKYEVIYQSLFCRTVFSGFLCRICLKQYNFDFSSSVDDIAGFQMMYIVSLFDFYYCFTRWLIDLGSMCTVWFVAPSAESAQSIIVLTSVFL